MAIDLNKLKPQQKGLPKIGKGSHVLAIEVFKRRITDKHKSRFYSDLYMLLSSGLDLKSSFDILEDQTEGARLKACIHKAKIEIVAGAGLADALKSNQLGDEYEYYSVQIGENTGKTVEVLREIKLYYHRKIKQQRQVKSALTYPVLVLATAIGAVGFMLSVIVPMFVEVFQRFQGELPPLTRKIIGVSSFFRNNSILVILVIISLFFLYRYLRKHGTLKPYTDKIILKLPFIGGLVHSVQCARFCHSMSLLTGAHSPLVQALELAAKMFTFTPLRNAVRASAKGIVEGRSLHASLESTGFFGKKFTSMIRAAEEVNQLEQAFNQLLNQYNDEIDYKLGILGSFLEPVLIIFVGGLVAIILIAMYLPLFQIGTTIY